MAFAFVQEWPIVDGDTSTTNYDSVATQIGRDAPAGLIAHTAGFDHDKGVFRIFDIWDTREAGQKFIDETVTPIVGRMASEAQAQGRDDFTPPAAEYWYELHDVVR